MSVIFCIMLPSILGIGIYCSLIKERDYLDIIFKYLTFVLISNFIIMLILMFIAKEQISIITSISNNLIFSTKYVGLGIIINIALSFIVAICKKSILISLEDKQ